MITQSRLKELLDYVPETGIFTWLQSPSRSVVIGNEAGSLSKVFGYISITLDKKRYQAHRLAWLYVYGVLPLSHIDHINNLRNDNSIKNLRLASPSENQWNRLKGKDNTSGYKGVNFHKSKNKWRATIKIDKKSKHIGYFETALLAHEAYCEAAKTSFGDYFSAGIAK